MNLDYLLLPLAILCLWLPGSLTASGKIRDKVRQGSRRNHEGLSSLLRSKFNWFDLVRSALGAWLLQRQIASFHDIDPDSRWMLVAAQLLVLAIGFMAQVVWLDRKIQVVGPLFYLVGLTLATAGVVVGGFALVLCIDCALMARRLSSCFFFGPVCLAAFGFLFHQLGIPTLFNAALFAIPGVLAFALGTRVAFVRRPDVRRTMRTSAPAQTVELAAGNLDAEDLIPLKEQVPSSMSTFPSRHSRDYLKSW